MSPQEGPPCGGGEAPPPPIPIRGHKQPLSQVKRTGNVEVVRLDLGSPCPSAAYGSEHLSLSCHLSDEARPPTPLSCWRDRTQELNGGALNPSLYLSSGQQDRAEPLRLLQLATNASRSEDPRNS